MKIRSEVGIVSILVNNAGIMPALTILQQSEQDIRRTFDINVMAHLWVRVSWSFIGFTNIVNFPVNPSVPTRDD